MYLRNAVLVAAALGIQSAIAHVPRSPIPRDTCRRTTVAILGGGMAGITAARALSNNSVDDFVIVEYNKRVGGRATHMNFGKKADGSPWSVELGPNWIQGLGNAGGPQNPVWLLAQKYGLKNHYSNYSSIDTYDATGHVDYANLIDEYQEAFSKAATKAGRMLVENVQDESVRSALSMAGWNLKVDDMRRQAVEWWQWNWESAMSPEQSSLIFAVAGGNLSMDQFGPANNLVTDPRGFRHIIEEESKTFLKPGDTRLLLNSEVTDIAYSDAGVTVHNRDGSCISAAYAICTFSLGVLQSGNIRFKPELPEWKQSGIAKFSMGTYTKLFMQFNETFWPKDKEYFLYASPTERGHYTVWQSLTSDGFLPGSNIIFATLTEEHAWRAERQSDEKTKAEMLEVLRQMFPNATVPEPTAFFYPRWSATPWAYGSYSNWPLGTTLEMHQNMRANLDRVWFAGEATSAGYFGFLQGAWFEGMEAGTQIAALLKGECAQVYGTTQCGTRPHYETLYGTSPLEHYTGLNGWPTSSL